MGNNQFNLSPMRIPEQPFCQFLNGTYREYESIFDGTSNYPKVGSDGLCPFPAGHYWNRDLVFDVTKLPAVTPEGFWRVTMLLRGPTGTVDFIIYAKLSKESFW
nr:uncharacterized protein LOC109432585 [Aedes albopictus]